MRSVHPLLFAFLLTARASACECIVSGTVSDAYEHSTVVVAAEAISTSTALGPVKHGGDTMNGETQTVQWKVLESWKGLFVKGQTFETSTVVQCCMCGRSVVAGGLMLLFLDGTEPYKVSTCGHTAELKEVLHEIPELHALQSKHAANGA